MRDIFFYNREVDRRSLTRCIVYVAQNTLIMFEFNVLTAVLVVVGIISFIVKPSKKGHILDHTTNLPDVLYTVLYISPKQGYAIVKEQTVKAKEYFVDTKVFGGNAIEVKDTVCKSKTKKDPVLGFVKLTKDEEA